MQKGLQKEKGGLYIKQGLFMNEDSPTVMFATRSMISKGALDIIKGLFMKEYLPPYCDVCRKEYKSKEDLRSYMRTVRQYFNIIKEDDEIKKGEVLQIFIYFLHRAHAVFTI